MGISSADSRSIRSTRYRDSSIGLRKPASSLRSASLTNPSRLPETIALDQHTRRFTQRLQRDVVQRQLFAIGVSTELLESRERPGTFVEITRFGNLENLRGGLDVSSRLFLGSRRIGYTGAMMHDLDPLGKDA